MRLITCNKTQLPFLYVTRQCIVSYLERGMGFYLYHLYPWVLILRSFNSPSVRDSLSCSILSQTVRLQFDSTLI